MSLKKTNYAINSWKTATQIRNSIFFLFTFFSLCVSNRSYGEGTRQLMPTSTDNGYIQIFDQNTITRPFASFNCPLENRLNIRICNAGEIIYMGFQQTDNDVYFRLKAPNGTTVPIPGLTPVALNTYLLPAAGMGRITSYNQAFNGPSAIAGAGGYNAIVYTNTVAGDYSIEFNPGNPTTINPVKRVFTYFDITVASAANARINGRVWSETWDFTTNAGANAFKAIMHVYSDDGIVTALNFNGMQPFGFTMSCNATGCTDTGNTSADRASRFGNSTYAQYKIFLNDPDPSCFPTGTFGTITAPSTVTGCGTNKCINVSVDKPGNVGILLDLNMPAGYQPGTRDRQLYATVVPGTNCIPWDGRDGLGNIVTSGLSFSIQIDYFNGLTHLPLFDVEDNPNGYIVTLSRPAGPAPRLFWDDAAITTGTATDGLVNLNGCSLATGCHRWRGRGNNSNPETINTWWYANIISDTLQVAGFSITADADTRNPGTGSANDTTVCGLINPKQLSGGVTGATGGTWSSTGTGSFNPSNATLNATYTPTATDISNGFVYLKLTSTGNGGCPAMSDSLRMTFQPAPSVSAGSPQTKCANNASTVLNGSFTNATGIRWTGGAGTFVPNNSTTNATYNPSTAEITAGTTTLTITTQGNGVCNAVTDQVIITIQAAPTAFAGTDQTSCSNNPNVTLVGTVSNASSQNWTGGTGTFNPGNTSLTATYTPSAAEITAGSATLTLNANRAGCITVSDQMRININAAPVVNAGSDQTVCHNNPNVTLNGSVTNTTTYAWSGGTGTFTPNNSTLSAVYTPTLAERNSGSITLTLVATRAGCSPVSDQMKITITSAPVVSAGNDKTVCANNPLVTLAGTSTTGNGTWSGGCGIYVPGAANLNNQYTPCASEISQGTVSLILTSTNNGNCIAVSDTMTLVITPAPISNANVDRSVCANNPSLALAGVTTNATSGVWSGGTGIFTPSPNVLTAQYTPSTAEITAGTVTLTLTANRNTCNPVTDQMVISITPRPTVNAGSDRSVCHNNSNVSLNGVVTIATGGTWSGGTGTFTPNANTLNATYTPTLTERNSGTVTLTLNTTGNGTCNAVNDQMIITITPSPTVSAGTDKTVCANNPTTTLTGTVSTSGGTWSGGGTFNPNASTLNPSFTPSTAQIAAGSATLTLTTTGNGNCNPVSDQVLVTIIPAPIANAGTDRTVCADVPSVTLSGSVTTASGGTWSGGAGSFTPNNNTLNATYTPTIGEINTGTVTLTLTTTGNGLCNPVSDAMTIFINPAPTVNAGADKSVCGNTTNVPLSGTITIATGGTWTTSGTGSFSPNATTLNASYVPSAADKTAGTVTLTLRTTGNGLCNAVSDALTVTFTTVPSINAGPDQIVCANNLPIRLNASGSAALWSGGSGTFTPSANALNATYTPTTGEIASGAVTLTATTIAAGACPVVSDQVTITIPPAPIADAGSDITMCGNLTGAALNGNITNATGGFWTTTGTGSFIPNATTLNATYRPSTLDKNKGSVTLTLTTTGNGTCTGHSDQLLFTIQPAITVNSGPNQTICADITTVPLNGVVTNVTGGVWTSSGSGNFSPNNVTLNASYIPSAADLAGSSFILTLSSTGNGACPVQTDQTTYTIRRIPIANAGANQAICADASSIALNGSIARANGALWTSSGSGIFSDASALTTTYNFSAADKSAGSVTFTLTTTGNSVCSPAIAQKVVTINPAPTVSAGSDKAICADAGAIVLNGSVTVATGGIWSTSGSGTFNNANLLNASYTPSANDITNGIVTLSLTTTGNGLCNAVSDQLIISISPAPTVNAGFDQTICANTTVSLRGIISVATGGTWTSNGSGTFTPSTNALNGTYIPSPADTASGSVILTLTTSGNGTCKTYSDQLTLFIQKIPQVNAGPNRTICADSSNIVMNGSAVNTNGIIWTTSGTGNFFPSATTLNASYVPSPADKASGNITLTITSTSNGSCAAASSRMTLTITPAPTVNAGSDQIICADSSFVNLNGIATVASGAIWASTGTGTFSPNNTTMNATYTPSANDKLAGSVSLSLTTTGNGTCKAVSDNLIVTITPAPTVNAGANQTVCANTSTINLNGTVTTATGGNWTSTGTGGFSPNSNITNASYFVTAADTAAGSVTLTLTSTGNGTCKAVSNQVTISFDPVPLVSAGADKTVCASATAIPLTGSMANATGATWTRTGSGSFAPNSNTLTANYVPSAADTVAGSVTLTLTTSGSGTCPSVSDQMTITIDPLPIVSAGPDQTVCADAGGVQLSGSLINASTGTWTTNGSGNFTPNTNDLNAIYYSSNADTTAGTIIVTLTSTAGVCSSVSDNMRITFTPAPTVDAGPDFSVCTGLYTAGINLQGKVTVATGGIWASNGSGSFSNPNNLNTVYYPTLADEAAGTLTFTLITTGNGSCNFYTDAMNLSFAFPTAMISAGNDTTVCSNGFPVQLKGSGTTGRWSGGLGTFTPNDSTLNARYIPAASEITTGSVSLTITAIGMGNCTPATDQVTITLPQGPTASAGTDQNLCSNSAPVALNGSVTIATGGTWTSTGSGSFANANATTTTYTPSLADKNRGTVTFTLTTTGNGVCGSSNDKMTVSIIQGPTISAGLDQVICSNASVKLSASFTNATGMQWSGGNGTFNASNTSPIATYMPTPAEVASGTIVLTASTTGTGICPPATDDQIIINFTPSPTVSAGTPQNVCASVTSVNLSGTVNIATGGFWTTLGTGSFTSSPSLLNTKYRPSTADTAAGFVRLVLTTTGNGTCNSVRDTVRIDFAPMPIVEAGPADTICSANIGVALTGHVLNAGGGLWQTLGTGNFTPSATNLSTTYNQSMLDNSRNSVTLRLTSTTNGPCPAVSDFVIIKIITSPFAIINAGLDNSVCADLPSIQLRGQVGAAAGGLWTSTGSGSFAPSNTDMNGTYVPSATDKTSGSVVITLTTTGNGICTASSDNTLISIAPTPIVTSGSPPNQTICADGKTVTLNGSVTNAVGGIWTTSGTGYFTPSASSLNAIYIPSSLDKSNGSVGLTLTSTGNGTCNPVKDNFLVTITPAPIVNAGTDVKICAHATTINLLGIVNNASGGSWTSSGSGTFSNANAPITSYTPSLNDTTSKEILLTLTSSGNGICNAVSDQVKVTFQSVPKVDAGPDQLICSDNNNIHLNGVVLNTNGVWSTSGSGSFSDVYSLTSNYSPSQLDTANGSVTLTLTTWGNNVCNPITDQVVLSLQHTPIVNAGSAIICDVNAGTQLHGSVVNAAGGIWTSTGSGTFSLNPDTLNSIYYPSLTDVANGNVTLILTTTGNGVCSAKSHQTILNIEPLPFANAGQDEFICRGSSTILAAETSSNVNYQWTTLSGSVIGNTPNVSITTSVDNVYILTLSNSKGCISKDTVQVSVYDLPSFNLPSHHCLSNSLIVNSDPQNLPSVPGEFQWYRNNIIITGEDKSVISPIEAGTFKITYSYGNCSVAANTSVTPIPILTHKDVIACENSMANITIKTNLSGATYAWAIGGSTSTVAVNVPMDTTYFSATVTDVLGCASTDSVMVIGIPVPQFNMTDSAGACQGTKVILDARPTNIANIDQFNPVYKWFKNVTPLTNTNDTLLVDIAGKYIVNVSIGQCSSKDSSVVNFNPIPVSALVQNPKFCKETDHFQLLNAGAGDSYTYLWSPSTGALIDSNTTQTIGVQTQGLYAVTITNKFNCQIKDSTFVREACPPRLFVPNAFLPGSEGEDQHFKVFGSYFRNYKMEIYNRWGEVIFMSFDRNESWDGTYLGEPMPVGVYNWVVTYEGEDPDLIGPYRKEGSVTVVR